MRNFVPRTFLYSVLKLTSYRARNAMAENGLCVHTYKDICWLMKIKNYMDGLLILSYMEKNDRKTS